MVIFDTSIIVDASRSKPDAIDLIESYLGKEKIAITVISKYEMLRGVTEHDACFVSQLLKNLLSTILRIALLGKLLNLTKSWLRREDD
jgi:predicted nucleic acid-binding protein